MGDVVHAIGFCSEKSAAFVPSIVMLEIFSGASPVLRTSTACGGTVSEPTGCVPKFNFPELKDTLGIAEPLARNFHHERIIQRRRLLAARASYLDSLARISRDGKIPRVGCASQIYISLCIHRHPVRPRCRIHASRDVPPSDVE